MNKDGINTSPGKDIKISLTKRKAIREKRNRMLRLVVFISALCVIMLVLVLTLFLKVDKITVEGNEGIDAQDIISASEIKKGINIITLSSKETEEKIKNKIPEIKSVKLKKVLPSSVVIEVTQAQEIMFLAVGQKYYSLDSSLRVVEAYDSIETVEIKGLKRIYLPAVTKCIMGEELETADTDIPDMVKQLHTCLEKYDLFFDVSEIDFKDKFDININLGVKYKVKLGNILECDTKLEVLCGILEELDEGDIGTIDFSDGEIGNAVFSRG